jgi:hypothetical protein
MQGALAITAPALSSFAPVTLNGTDQTTTAALGAIRVTDARDSAAGWHITVQATQFWEWDGRQYVPQGATLAPGSLQLAQPDLTAAHGILPAGVAVAAGPYIIDTGLAVTIARAALGTGLGWYDLPATSLTLRLPASVYARTYRSTVVVSVISGP